MNTSRGFVSLALILALVIGFVALGGVGYYVTSQKDSLGVVQSIGVQETSSEISTTSLMTDSTTQVGQQSTVTTSAVIDVQQAGISPAVVHSGAATIAPIPAVVDMTQNTPYHITTATGRLFLYSKQKQFIPLVGLSKTDAQHICFETGADKCLYEGGAISPDSSPTAYDIKILDPQGGAFLKNPSYVTVKIHDGGPAGEYHLYLKHYSASAGGIDQVYEGHLTKLAGSNPYDLIWDMREVSLDGSAFLNFKSLPEGNYALTVVNSSTAAASETIITIGDSATKRSYIKPYTEGTPFFKDSDWDGRGIMMDGDGGIDTLQLAGKMAEYQVYRGKDMPEKNQLNTIVLRQNVSGVVIVATNDEILKFDDITLSIPALTPIAR